MTAKEIIAKLMEIRAYPPGVIANPEMTLDLFLALYGAAVPRPCQGSSR